MREQILRGPAHTAAHPGTDADLPAAASRPGPHPATHSASPSGTTPIHRRLVGQRDATLPGALLHALVVLGADAASFIIASCIAHALPLFDAFLLGHHLAAEKISR
ncbi:MAG: hypothetical protein KBF58_04155 [Methyloversatilis sp.]|nr:hypothetical protein [Methyloversatilis sp.]MBP6193295.1 hypothetical protein [Methyloversatilis sp.]MBP9117254.1 hypothetical protein [Methyloversatilis sp.]